MSDPNSGSPDAATPDDPAPSSPASHDAHAVPDGAAGDEHGPGEEHGHGEALGPIDWAAWGAGFLGLAIGLGTAVAFAVATNRLG